MVFARPFLDKFDLNTQKLQYSANHKLVIKTW